MKTLVNFQPPALSPLSLAQLVRDTWGMFDPAAIAQLAPLAADPCYQLKFYKAPSDDLEVFAADGFIAYGLRITPGSIIFGFYLPVVVDPDNPTNFTGWNTSAKFTVQIRDVSLNYEWFDSPLSSLFLANARPRYQVGQFPSSLLTGSFPNLLTNPYPVTGSGLFMVEIQSQSADTQRIEVVLGVLEVCQ